VLKDPIVDDRQGLPILGAEKHNEAAKSAWLDAILQLVLSFRPTNDIGFHPSRENPIAPARTFHASPTEVAVLSVAGRPNVNSWTMDSVTRGQIMVANL
jgi:hypothetical protein